MGFVLEATRLPHIERHLKHYLKLNKHHFSKCLTINLGMLICLGTEKQKATRCKMTGYRKDKQYVSCV